MEKINKNNFASNFLGKTERVAVVGGGEVVDDGTGLKSKTHVNKIDLGDEMQKLTKRNEYSSINETLVTGGRCACENPLKKQTGRDVTQTVSENRQCTFCNIETKIVHCKTRSHYFYPGLNKLLDVLQS